MKHSFLDKHSGLVSAVHSIDPRVKFLAAFSAILIIVSEPHGRLLPFVFYGPVILWVAAISKIPAGYMLKRCLIVSPFIIMAAVSYPLSRPGSGWQETGQILTAEVMSGLSIFLKAFYALVLLILLTSTGRFHLLLAGLRKLGMPRLPAVISALMYRYVFILHDELLRTNRARDSRTPGKIRISRLKVYGNQAAMIFMRSMERSQSIYHSMLSRGFTGEFPDMDPLRLRSLDVLKAVTFVLLLLAVRIFTPLLTTNFNH